MPAALLRFTGSVERDPAIKSWLDQQATELRPIAQTWFNAMRSCGRNVSELIHDGYATVCVQDAPFAYVGCFKAHVNVGFFQGASLPDPYGLLEGTGKNMRHVKLRPGQLINVAALEALIAAAYRDVEAKLSRGG